MKKETKIFIGALAVLVVAGGAGMVYEHQLSVQTAKRNLAQAKTELTSAKGDLLEATNTFSEDKSAYESNFAIKYSETKFTKKETVVLPQNMNYKPNNATFAKWFVTYANELRKLNGNNTPLVWSEDSNGSLKMVQ